MHGSEITLDEAIVQKIQRDVKNELSYKEENICKTIVKNTTSAESAVRDTDMASGMVKYSNNILAQAGQTMLAQANQRNQGVLSLLG